jgi:hypothetical protein
MAQLDLRIRTWLGRDPVAMGLDELADAAAAVDWLEQRMVDLIARGVNKGMTGK